MARLRSCPGGALRPTPLGNNTRFLRFFFFFRGLECDRAEGVSPSKVKILGLPLAGAPVSGPAPGSPRPESWRRLFMAWYFCLMRMTACSDEEREDRLGVGLSLCCSSSVSPSTWSTSSSPSVWEAEALLPWSLICRDTNKR